MKKYLALLFLTSNCYAVSIDLHKMHSFMMVDEKDMPFSTEHKVEINNKKMKIERYGYYNTNEEDRYILFLKNLKKIAPQVIKSSKGTFVKGDTNLKQSAGEIKLAFTFKKLPIDDKNIIGYAPIGQYQESPVEGWNGIKIYFDSPEIANVCAYEYTDLNISHGGVVLDKNSVGYSINNKPTLTSIEGNPSVGFRYSVVWYNTLKVSRIDCVTYQFDQTVIQKMTQLANKIDQNGLVVNN